MSLLEELYNKYNCDKGSFPRRGKTASAHHYFRVYQSIFEKFKDKEINILEIGVWRADSFRAHIEYFSKAKIYGLDIFTRIEYDDQKYDDIKKNDRVSLIKGDSTNIFCLSEFYDLKFDIIIDDGSHLPGNQLKTFNIFYKLLNEGGTYFIEDVWPQHLLSDEQKERDLLKYPILKKYISDSASNNYSVFYNQMIDEGAIEWDMREFSKGPASFIFQIDHV